MSSLNRASIGKFEKLHHAYLTNEMTSEVMDIQEHFKERLRFYVKNRKTKEMNDEDLNDIVSRAIELTIKQVKEDSIVESFIGAALSNADTALSQHKNCFFGKYRRQIKGDRNTYIFRSGRIFQEDGGFNFDIQQALGASDHYLPEIEMLKQEKEEMLKQEIHRICDERTSKIIFHFYFGYLSVKEIGSLLGIKTTHVSTLKRRGLKLIKKQLSNYFDN
ncbi:hypothetical protein [Paenibacillus donghaensis]|uniref:Uncharacterized protein n=1 Tax=Paenibacillus donghaensis TaxID=414771 RepID=A0A2Z2KLQ8_9BACL|nr:hypothetical protein [Paenibacillus donghaensis]ASA23429.1 hypothetical protein B9T62_23050 [Paenibacillus donghaensis]